MLEITVPSRELFNDTTQEFIVIPSVKLTLEHSLISLWKWESKWNKPFLNNKELNGIELTDYVRCMTIGKEADPIVYEHLSNKNIKKIKEYMDHPMSATTFRDSRKGRYRNEIITAEILYYWMIEYGIPFECEKWHLNRLLSLIRVCNIKGSQGKKMSQKEIMKENAALNAVRRRALGSKG